MRIRLGDTLIEYPFNDIPEVIQVLTVTGMTTWVWNAVIGDAYNYKQVEAYVIDDIPRLRDLRINRADGPATVQKIGGESSTYTQGMARACTEDSAPLRGNM